MISGIPGFFGTGVWPYRISGKISNYMVLGFNNKPSIDYLSRDYLSILYMPLIPLGLSALSKDQHYFLYDIEKEKVVDATRRGTLFHITEPNRRLAWVRQNWFLALMVAAGGALLGYLAVGYLAHSWQLGLDVILGGLVGCGVVNRFFLHKIS